MLDNIVVLRKVQDISIGGSDMGDLKKLDPMARKMKVHINAFYKAVEENDSAEARGHISEILKFGEYIHNDIENMISKSDKVQGVNDVFAGGAPVRRFNQTETVHPHSDTALPGTIRTNRVGSIMRPQSNRTL